MKWLGRPGATLPTSTATSPIRLEAADLPPGYLIADWRVERRRARGATGVLYVATDTTTDQLCAVKVWCPLEQPQDFTAERARFLREARAASELEHSHIVPVDAGGVWADPRGELAFLVMSLLPGRDLSYYTQRRRLLPEALSIQLGFQMAEALHHAHRRGVVHRDVKPSNVMFDPASSRAWLTDFGLARLPNADHTKSGVMLGSPASMAPELLAGGPADARTDLYALGVLLFELLTGRLPYEASSLGELLQAIHRRPRLSVPGVRPDLPIEQAQALDELIAPLLEREPSQRMADGAVWVAWAASRARHVLPKALPSLVVRE
jgi:eukaryotic-like serine/threonine-protein kinase